MKTLCIFILALFRYSLSQGNRNMHRHTHTGRIQIETGISGSHHWNWIILAAVAASARTNRVEWRRRWVLIKIGNAIDAHRRDVHKRKVRNRKQARANEIGIWEREEKPAKRSARARERDHFVNCILISIVIILVVIVAVVVIVDCRGKPDFLLLFSFVSLFPFYKIYAFVFPFLPFFLSFSLSHALSFGFSFLAFSCL